MKIAYKILASALGILSVFPAVSSVKSDAKCQLLPLPGDNNVNVDTRLSITFGSTPVIGNSGKIRIYDADTDECIDSLDMSIPAGPTVGTKLPKAPYALEPYIYDKPRETNRTVKPGTPSGTAVTTSDQYQLNIIGGFTDGFHFYPVIVNGNKAEIYPHNNMLDYGKSYYVTIDPEVFSIKGREFQGLTKKDGWKFKIKDSAPDASRRTLVVSSDGRGDFNTVQGALDHIPDFNKDAWTVVIMNGDYEELVYIRNKQNVIIEGESREGVYVHYANNEVFNPHPENVSTNEWLGTFPSRRAPFTVDHCNDITLRNFTVATTLKGQAEGLLINGRRNRMERMTVIGSGDCLQANGQLYLNDCKIDGGGDMILGRGTCFFRNCTLISGGPFAWIRNGSGNHGNVFVDCTFKGTHPDALLARTNGTYPHCEMVLINCKLENIAPEGWSGIDRGPYDYVRYWEAGSMNADGSPADLSKRAKGSRQLDSQKDASLIKAYSNPEFVFDGWNPEDASH